MRLIYDYKAYRAFLKDYYLSQKEKNPSFSYAVFAKQVGLSSSAHIQLILSGKRNLTVHNIHRVAETLSLPQGELDFFETLVHLNQAEGVSEKKFYAERLLNLSVDKPQSSRRLKVSFLLSSGILPALLLSIEGKTLSSATSAGDRFGYSVDETEKVLKQLLKEGVIRLEEDHIRLSHRHLILHDKKAQSQAQKNFLSQQLRLSTRAFERMYEKEGKFFAHTFTINPAGMARYIDEVKTLLEKMTQLSDAEAGDSVMQLNLQLFPYEKSLQKSHID
ncbi:TIGR02147 family protein [Bdellovibrionota bacterium FG-2]